MTLNLIKKIPCCNKEKCFKEFNDFISKLQLRDYLLEITEEVCAERMKANGYKNEFECCDTAKLFLENIPDELLNVKIGIRHEYLLTDSENNQFEVTIDEISSAGKYIQIKKYYFDITPLKIGKIDLVCILDYDKLPDMDKLKQVGFETFPSFHETHIEVIKKENNHLYLRFSGGFHPLVTDVKMDGVFKEETCMENNMDPYKYFTQDGCVGGVQFQTINNHFIVKVSDDYTSDELIGWYKGISSGEIKKLRADPNKRKTKKHIHEYTIYCSNISFKFKRAD